jgi:hypothetical protein
MICLPKRRVWLKIYDTAPERQLNRAATFEPITSDGSAALDAPDNTAAHRFFITMHAPPAECNAVHILSASLREFAPMRTA